MGCSSCRTVDGQVAGCKNNGGCLTGGCNKLNVFDWLSNMSGPLIQSFDGLEVRFKNGRKEFYRNTKGLQLDTGEAIIVDVPNGHHLGHVSMQGELVRLQMRRKNVANDETIRVIYRKATLRDIDKYEELQHKELSTMYRAREIIQQHQLEMKLTDVEFQADGGKATFYYSADDRVDFRELIKALASEFRIRIEMRQISLRQEAGRLGGIGSCGRELCCSTWLTDFKSVSTSAARYQNLSLNPSKLSGQCGRLKCCLNYELDSYMEAIKDIPAVEGPLITEKGQAYLQKTDIFRKILWFAYKGENTWHSLLTARVAEILELNRRDKSPASLASDEAETSTDVMNSDLLELDRKLNKRSKTRKRKKRKKNQNKSSQQNNRNQN